MYGLVVVLFGQVGCDGNTGAGAIASDMHMLVVILGRNLIYGTLPACFCVFTFCRSDGPAIVGMVERELEWTLTRTIWVLAPSSNF
jgi:hypothetical protein